MKRWSTKKGQGAHFVWLRAHVSFQGEECLIWPFYRHPDHGRGVLGHEGRNHYAHRLMCIFAHGEPTTPKHEAAHNCGNGHLGCVNPRHLEWKTRAENKQDSAKHGTAARSRHGIKGKLTQEQADEIRALRGIDLQKDIAARYGVSPSAITQVWKGITFARQPKITLFTPEHDQIIRDAVARGVVDFGEIAPLIGRTAKAIEGRMYRLGLNRGGRHPQKPSSQVSLQHL